MNALVRKELRLLLPTWIAGMALAILPGCIVALVIPPGKGREFIGLFFFCFGLGVLLLSVAAFGQEISAGTFSMLLAQPARRSRLWRAKVGVLGLAMLSVWGAFIIFAELTGSGDERQQDLLVPSLIIPLVAVGGALWTTLVLRQVASAFWLTFLIPLFICAALSPLDERHPEVCKWSVIVGLSVYAVSGFWWARRMFYRAQDVGWASVSWYGRTVSAPSWLTRNASADSVTPDPVRKPLRSLIKKELQLQYPSMLFGGILLLFHLGIIGVRKWNYDPANPAKVSNEILSYCWVMWSGLAALAGATAVADERREGTFEAQLCLPVSCHSQWGLKLAVAMLLGVLLGGVMPAILESGAILAGVPSGFFQSKAGELDFENILIWLGILAAGIAFIAFYSSTLMRNVIQAVSAGVAIAGVLMAFWAWTVTGAVSVGLWRGPLVTYAAVPSLIVVLLWLSLRNFRLLSVGKSVWLYNAGSSLFGLLIIVGLTGFTYNRGWEYFTPLEPPHGPAQTAGSIRPRICFAGVKTFVLLPDGRLWVADRVEARDTSAYKTVSEKNEKERHIRIRMAVPVTGTFLGGSNWVDLANSFFPMTKGTNRAQIQTLGANTISAYNEVIGLQADGTLWRIFLADSNNALPRPTPERIGADSDWAAIAGGGSHFLALKRDGSLWGWGQNGFGQVGSGHGVYVSEPACIGTNTDWVSMFVSGATSIAVKKDGSVWRWGYWLVWHSYYNQKSGIVPHPVPERWSETGRDWLDIENMTIERSIVLKKDGTLLWEGNPGLKGYSVDPGGKLQKLSSDANYKCMSLHGPVVVFVESDGTLITKSFLSTRPNGLPNPLREPSRYSDWLTASSDWAGIFVSLAADGTLSCWANQDESRLYPPLLCPSRKPLWSVNILAEAERK